jgi:hypothetical protein
MSALPALSQSPGNRSSQTDPTASKNDKLQQLRRDNLEERRMWQALGRKTRKEQMEKAMAMTRNNPLAVDQAAEYDRNITRLRRKYVFKDL